MPDHVKQFKIAHLSDLHLTARDRDERSEPKLFGRLSGMNERFDRVAASRPVQSADLVLVTGDVTDRGHINAWRRFWGALDKAKAAAKTWVVPGNHDLCCLGLRMPGSRSGYARADLERAARGLRLAGHHPDSIPWVARPDPRVSIFGVNSNNLGNWNAAENAVGKIGYHQLSRLARLLRDDDAPVKILALHHSPNIPGAETEKKRRLKETGWLSREGYQIDADQRKALRLLCTCGGARLMVHGHLHRREDREVDGVRIVGAPPSTEPLASGPHAGACEIATYSIRGPKNLVHVNWRHV